MSATTMFRRLFAPRPTAVRTREPGGRRGPLRVETLETRVLLASHIGYDDGVRNTDYGWNFVARIAEIGGTGDRPDLKGFHVVGTDGRDEIRVWEIDGTVGVAIWSEGGDLYGETQYASTEDVPHIFIEGFGGNDLITVQSSAINYIWGGAGNDTIFGGNGPEGVVDGEDGNDVLELGPVSGAEVYGGSGNDVLRGGRLDDHLSGGEGDDTLFGNAGMDYLYGDGGNDQVYGGSDPDFLHGGVGSDVLYGEGGDDILFGGPEVNAYYVDNDSLFGGAGQDWLLGGEGADYLDGGRDGSRDVLQGQRGADTFKGNGGLGTEDNNLDYNAGQGDQVLGLFNPYSTVAYASTAYSIASLGSGYAAAPASSAASLYASAYNTSPLAAVATDPINSFAETYATGDYHFLSAEIPVEWTVTWVAPPEAATEEVGVEPVDDAAVPPEATGPTAEVVVDEAAVPDDAGADPSSDVGEAPVGNAVENTEWGTGEPEVAETFVDAGPSVEDWAPDRESDPGAELQLTV